MDVFLRSMHLTSIVFEFFLILTLLVLFTSASSKEYHTALWQDGGTQGWNSDPHQRVYDYANYRESPPIPIIWDETWQQCHVYFAIVMAVIWVSRLRVQVQDIEVSAKLATNVLYDVVLIASWTYSTMVQCGGDITDPAHISLRPWYLDRRCNEAGQSDLRACEVAKILYGLTIFTVVWHCLRLLAVCMLGAYLYGVEQGRARGMRIKGTMEQYV
ncbi:hypothetical protein GQ44DRAFT_764161 [Phaeosphaeriaceae sp. PMI808]|nr:hypothetical protein GQ44DRAFT_764161 [Phaeosphaeriaceae sp. PMI808]